MPAHLIDYDDAVEQLARRIGFDPVNPYRGKNWLQMILFFVQHDMASPIKWYRSNGLRGLIFSSLIILFLLWWTAGFLSAVQKLIEIYWS